jgi:serine/threonine protein kinase
MEAGPVDSVIAKRSFNFRTCLGRGGFGEVYLASMTSSGGVRSDVAVKVLHAELDPRSQAIGRLRDEGKLLGQLNHPSILRVTDLVVLDGRVALVMEYVEGADLDRCLHQGLSKRGLVEVIGRVADALNAAYTTVNTDGQPLHLIHRDIKPANIRVGRHGDVKLLDFGIARAANVPREVKTQTNALIGSSLYMAPERLDEDIKVEPSSDVFSLGSTLYEGLSGKRFYEGQSIRQQYMLALVRDKYEQWLAEQLRAVQHVEPALFRLVADLLAYHPEDRPTPNQLSRRCDELAESLAGESLRRWCKDREWTDVHDIGNGAFTGRTLSEATATLSGAYRVPARAPGPDDTLSRSRSDYTGEDNTTQTVMSRSSSFALGLVAAGFTVLALSIVAATITIVVLANREDVTDATGMAQTVPEPTLAPVPAPAQIVPEPVPEPTVAPHPEPKVVSPSPRPVAAPVVSNHGAWTSVARVPVELRGAAGTFQPGSVVAGPYEVWADFGSGMIKAGDARVEKDANVSIGCSRLRQDCTAK